MKKTMFVLKREDSNGYCYLVGDAFLHYFTDDLGEAKKFASHHEVFWFLHNLNGAQMDNGKSFNGGDTMSIVEVRAVQPVVRWEEVSGIP